MIWCVLFWIFLLVINACTASKSRAPCDYIHLSNEYKFLIVVSNALSIFIAYFLPGPIFIGIGIITLIALESYCLLARSLSYNEFGFAVRRPFKKHILYTYDEIVSIERTTFSLVIVLTDSTKLSFDNGYYGLDSFEKYARDCICKLSKR